MIYPPKPGTRVVVYFMIRIVVSQKERRALAPVIRIVLDCIGPVIVPYVIDIEIVSKGVIIEERRIFGYEMTRVAVGQSAGSGAGGPELEIIRAGIIVVSVGHDEAPGAGTGIAAPGIIKIADPFSALIPEGFAVLANFRDKGMSRAQRLGISASFVLPVVGAALLAYFGLRGRSEPVKMAGLVFVAGLYTLAAVEDMLHEAHESAEDTRWSAISFLGGFALFLLLSGLFG